VTIPIKTSQETRYNFSLASQSFWGRRPDGAAIRGNEARQIVHILSFTQSTDRDEVKEAKANGQRQSIIGVLRAAAPKWDLEQISFVVGNHRSVLLHNECIFLM